MPNLSLTQDVVAQRGTPLLQAAVRTLLDPFRSATVLAEAAAGSLDAPTPVGLPTWLFVLRSASLLEPPHVPAWRTALEGAAARASTSTGTLPWPTGGEPRAVDALVNLWLRRMGRVPTGPDPRGLYPTVEAAISRRDVATLCAVVAAQGYPGLRDDGVAGRARGALVDLLTTSRLDGMDLPLVLESAILSGAGPKDRLARLARESLGRCQDARGMFPSALGDGASLEATWWALLLLMRGG
ncbi:MAG: hypothetical protein AB2A00_20815 [Myxococcota bacterium]